MKKFTYIYAPLNGSTVSITIVIETVDMQNAEVLLKLVTPEHEKFRLTSN